jgi:RHS repeat-associated protein
MQGLRCGEGLSSASQGVVTQPSQDYKAYGAPDGSAATAERFRRGISLQPYEPTTGVYLLNERILDPRTALFLSGDPAASVGNSDSLTAGYVYGNGDPYTYNDPDGQFAWFLIPIIIGAIIGGTAAAANHGNFGDILKGVGIGALAGAFFAAGQAYIGGALGAATAGAANAATDTAIFGGQASDILKATFQGFVIGGFGYALMGQQITIFGNGNGLAGTTDYLINCGVRGAFAGAAFGTLTGKDLGDSAKSGALAWIVGGAFNSALGHAWGFVNTGSAPSWENGYWKYEGAGNQWPITLGNVVSGDKDWLARMAARGSLSPLGSVEQHEQGHIAQSMTLGPAYLPAIIPAYLLGGLIGLANKESFMTGTHSENIFENDSGFISVPNY